MQSTIFIQVVAQARGAQMAAARLVLAACSDLPMLQQLSLAILKNVIPALDKVSGGCLWMGTSLNTRVV